MSENLIFHRGFETKVFSSKEDKLIFMIREYLIQTGVNIWLHRDIIHQYLSHDDENKKVKGLEDYFLHLSRGHIQLKNYSLNGLFFSSLIFIDDTGEVINIDGITIPTQQKILEIIGYNDFSLEDSKILGISDQSQSSAIFKLLHQLQKKHS